MRSRITAYRVQTPGFLQGIVGLSLRSSCLALFLALMQCLEGLKLFIRFAPRPLAWEASMMPPISFPSCSPQASDFGNWPISMGGPTCVGRHWLPRCPLVDQRLLLRHHHQKGILSFACFFPGCWWIWGRMRAPLPLPGEHYVACWCEPFCTLGN